MSQLQRACKSLGGLVLLFAIPFSNFAQTTNGTNFYGPLGGEYAPAGNLAGDQTHPSLAMGASGGYLVWQDNITDGSGLGISAVQLTSTFSTPYGNFRVNQQGTNDQENPQVALLHSGGAVFVWQSGPRSKQHIMARFMNASNLWITGDIQVNTATNYQVNPAVAVLTNGNVIVTWGSFGQDNTDGMQGVYGQILSPAGAKIGAEFRVNQFTPYNQRTPAVAAMPNGNFLIAWVSELERYNQTSFVNISNTIPALSVDIYARLFNSTGAPMGGEFLVNVLTNICANPTIAVASDGSFIVAWSQKDSIIVNNSWDVWARQFSSSGVGGTPTTMNTQLYGDQYGPKLASIGTDYLAVWTSLGQDGSREGVYGQFLHRDGSHAGSEFRVNTTVLNQQMFPTVASDGTGRFLAVWSSYVGGLDSLDLEAQEYIGNQAQLVAPAPPMVLPLDSYTLSVTWPPVTGFTVSYYQLFVDGSATPVTLTNCMWSSQNFNPSSTHTFQLAYVLANGSQSPMSALASGTTWGQDRNFDGLPDDWETKYYGTNQSNWPKGGASTVLAPGVTLLDVFLWGGNPNDPSTWLTEWISKSSEGYFLNWNTVAGGIYQVQTSGDFRNWTNLGSPRFEAGSTDSLYLGLSSQGYYRIVRNRY